MFTGGERTKVRRAAVGKEMPDHRPGILRWAWGVSSVGRLGFAAGCFTQDVGVSISV